MNTRFTDFMKKHSILLYFLLALFFSWMVELPLVATRQSWFPWKLPFSIHYLAAFGPMLAALTMTALVGGRAGLAELWGRISLWRVGWRWWLIAVGSPFLIFLLGLPVVLLVNGEWPDISLLGQANYLPDLGIGVLVIWVVTFGFGEEIGWRGFALPRLQQTMSVSRATLILALMWAFWHVPAFFYHETYQNFNILVIPGFFIGVLFGSVMFTWVYNGTRGSVLAVALWHGLFDFFTASKAGQDIIPIVMSGLLIMMTLIIANTKQPWGFNKMEKQMIGGEA